MKQSKRKYLSLLTATLVTVSSFTPVISMATEETGGTVQTGSELDQETTGENQTDWGVHILQEYGKMEIEVKVSNVKLEGLSEETPAKLVLKDSAGVEAYTADANVANIPPAVGMENPDTYYIIGKMEKLTDVITPGKLNLTLVIGEGEAQQEFDLGPQQIYSNDQRLWVATKGSVLLGQTEFAANIWGNMPNKDYFKISLVDEEGELIADTTSVEYEYADIKPNEDHVNLTANFKVLEGKALEVEKDYFYKAVDPEGKEIKDIGHLRVMSNPVILNTDLSKYTESTLSFKTANFKPEEAYTFSVSEDNGASESASGTGVIDENGNISVLFKDSENLDYKFSTNKGYSVRVKDSNGIQVCSIHVYMPHQSQIGSYIGWIGDRTLSPDTKSYRTHISVQGAELTRDEIESIQLVELDDKEKVMAEWNTSKDIQVSIGEKHTGIGAEFKITGTPEENKDYTYIVKTADGETIGGGGSNYLKFSNRGSVDSILISARNSRESVGTTGKNKFEYASDMGKLGFQANGITMADDSTKLDFYLEDLEGNKVGALNAETLEINGDKNKYTTGEIVLSEALPAGDYSFVVAYDGVEVRGSDIFVTDTSKFGDFGYKEREFIEAGSSVIELDWKNWLNLDLEKIEVVIRDNKGETLQTIKPLLETINPNAYYQDNQADGEEVLVRDIYEKMTVNTPEGLSYGEYTLELLYDGVVTGVSKKIQSTDKSIVTGNTSEYEGNILRVYEATGINLKANATYDVYVYSENYNPTTTGDMDKRQLIKKLEGVNINEAGNIELLSSDLKDLEKGGYKLFFEMDKKIIGSGSLSIREVEVSTVDFMINSGNPSILKSEVELDIKTGESTHLRIANSPEELESAEYTALSEAEKSAGKAKRNWTLSEGYGEKTVYVQFKDAEGVESVVSKSIIFEEDTVETPTDVKHSGGESIEQGETLTISASGTKEYSGYAEMLDAEGNLLSRIPLTKIGPVDGVYSYERAITLSSTLSKTSSIKVYFENTAGIKSEAVELPVNIASLGAISGVLSEKVGDDYFPRAYRAITLQKKTEKGEYEHIGFATTGIDGEFNFRNLKSGDYRLVTFNRGEETVKDITVASGADINNVEFQIESLYSETGTANITVVDSTGNPVEGASVSIGSWQTGEYRSGETDAEGKYTESLPTKSDGVDYYISAYNDGTSGWENMTLKPGENSKEIVLPAVATVSGTVLDKDEKPAAGVTVVGKRTSGWGWNSTTTDADGNYTLKMQKSEDGDRFNISVETSEVNRKVTLEKHEAVADGDTADFTVYDALKLNGTLKDASGEPLKDVWVYSSANWRGVQTEEDGKYDFGRILGVGTHKVTAWADGQRLEEEVVVTEEDIKNGAEKKVPLKTEEKGSPFTGEGNNVMASVSTVQGGKYFTVKVNYKNNGTTDITNAVLEATLPEGVTLKAIDKNSLTKEGVTLQPGESGSHNFTVEVSKDFTGKNINIPVKAVVGEVEYAIGFTDVEVVNVAINGPQTDSDGEFKVYGETVANGKISIIDNTSKKVLAAASPSGRWYTANISGLEDGDYELVARVEKDGNVAYSEALNVSVQRDNVEVEEISVSTAGGTAAGKNPDTGVAAFSAWVDNSLNGRDIEAEVKLSNTTNVEEVLFEFAGKEFTGTVDKDSNRVSADITGWSASKNEQLVMKLKIGDNWISFVVAEITVLIDPSGYVADKHSEDPIAGATAICEIFEGGEWKQWNAELYGQINPQTTDSEGQYGWMVPEGSYRVRILKDGYESYITTEDPQYSGGTDANGGSTIIIPPPRTDVNIGIVNIEQPVVESVEYKGGKVAITVSKAINPDTAGIDSIKLKDSEGKEIAGVTKPVTVSEAKGSKNKVIYFQPAEVLKSGTYSVLVDGVADFATDKTPAKELIYTGEFEVKAEETAPNPGPGTGGGSTGGGGGGAIPPTTEKPETPEKPGATETPTESTTVDSEAGGVVEVEGALTLDIPAGAFEGNVKFEASKVSNPPEFKKANLVSDVYEFRAEGINRFNKEIEIAFKIDKSKVKNSDRLAVYYFNEARNSWIYLGGEVSKDEIKVGVDHFTKFAVFEAPEFPEFIDMKGDWSEKYVNRLQKIEIVNGVADKAGNYRYNPKQNITREEFTKLVVEAMGIKVEKNPALDFSDNSEIQHWAKPYVAAAYKAGIIQGIPDENGKMSFAPAKNITRAEIVTMIGRSLDKSSATALEFSDKAEIPNWAKEHLATAVSNKIVEGYPDNSFKPQNNATRAEAAKMIYELLRNMGI